MSSFVQASMQTTIVWVADKQQQFISHGLEARNSKIKVLADHASHESLPPCS